MPDSSPIVKLFFEKDVRYNKHDDKHIKVGEFMLKNDIKALVDRMGITRYRFWKDTGVSRETAYDLYDNPGRIPKQEVMERLAETYGWQPGQYLYYDFHSKKTA